MTEGEIRRWLVERIRAARGLARETVDVNAPFDAFGVSSKDALAIAGDLGDLLGRDLPATIVYDHPTIQALAAHLAGTPRPSGGEARGRQPSSGSPEPVAVVGMACRFPGAPDPAAFWRLLVEGKDAVTEVPRERFDAAALYDPDPTVPGKSVTRWGGFLEGIERFDAHAFGISPGEAERMDPQQRLLLELSEEALEDAGVDASALAGSLTGVFVGASVNEYADRQLRDLASITGHSGTGSALSVTANRVSYTLGSAGPSLTVDTACSSSLAAVHLACRSLRTGECDLALVGGVNVILSPAHSVAFTKAGVLARDGRCKVFDARADGYVRAEGGALLVLKPLPRALRDGDRVYAVLRGSAMGHNGRTNGLMAPRREAQEALVRAACRDAGVPPARLQYVEAHGTGTLLGDAIEAAALGAVVGPGRSGPPCGIGSVKSNLGHLEAAAGVAGLMKVTLALWHGEVPPTLHVREVNPHIPFDSLGLRVVRERTPWDGSAPLLAGVSSFGFGGANVHVVLGAAPPEGRGPRAAVGAGPGRACLLPLSARRAEGLADLARGWAHRLAHPTPEDGDDLATLCRAASRRTHRAHRAAVVLVSREQGARALDALARGAGDPDAIVGAGAGGALAFVFSGQGSQGQGMVRGLLAEEGPFREALLRADAALRPHLGLSVAERLAAGTDPALDGIDVVQPTLFAVQVALARQWAAFGVLPDAVVGHSMGEVAAAHVAGALSLEDAALVISARSALLRRIAGSGAMASVGLPPEEALARASHLGVTLHVAARNGPRSTVLCGARQAIHTFVGVFAGGEVPCHEIAVDVAAHGPLTRPLAEELRERLACLTPRTAERPFHSSVTGGVVDGTHLDADYWARNLADPVRFFEAVDGLLSDGHRTFLEVSPHPVLGTPVQQAALERCVPAVVVGSLRRDVDDRSSLLHAAGRLYGAGRSLSWAALNGEGPRATGLPREPWRRERYWVEDSAPSERAPASARRDDLLGERVPLADVGDRHVWESVFDPGAHDFLRDHHVMGSATVPASAFVHLALAALEERGLGSTHELRDLAIPARLDLEAHGAQRVQTTLAPSSAPGASFALRVHGAPAKATPPAFTLHATATLTARGPDDAPRREAPTLAGLQGRLSRSRDVAELYRSLAERGLSYGPALRLLGEVRTAEGGDAAEALGRVALPRSATTGTPGRPDAALLDAALHVLAAIPGAGQACYLPVGARRIRAHAPLGAVAWSHGALRPPPPGASPSLVEADLTIFGEDGAPCLEIEGLRLQRASPRERTPEDLWRYGVRWERQEVLASERGASRARRPAPRVLLLGDRKGLAGALTSALSGRGYTCDVLSEAATRAPEALRRELSELRRSAPRPWSDVVHLAACDESGEPLSVDGVRRSREAACDLTLVLARELTTSPDPGPPPRLWLATRGAVAPLGGERVAVGSATLWGFGRSLRLELPDLPTTQVDLDPDVSPQDAILALADLLADPGAEDELALRAGKVWVPRLSTTSAAGAEGPSPVPSPLGVLFREDGTYLVTGGLGGLGIAVAGWAVASGARRLALLGRRAPGASAAAAIAALRRKGASVSVLAVDVADAGALNAALADLRRSGPPIRGVVHAAGILDNGALLDLDSARIAAVMAPKVEGAAALDLGTSGDPLDFFVLFSSAVSVLGSPGQAAYAGANAALDALAARRRAEGRPAVSVSWGPWAETGLVADGAFVEDVARRGAEGVKGIAPERGLEALEETLRGGAAHVVLLPFDLKALLEIHPAAAGRRFFQGILAPGSKVGRLYARPPLAQPYVAPRSDLEARIAEMWRRTLRIDRVGVDDSFFELGGDSVLAAQVITSIHRVFGVALDLKAAFAALTVSRLAAAVEEALLARVDALTEEEARRMLQG